MQPGCVPPMHVHVAGCATSPSGACSCVSGCRCHAHANRRCATSPAVGVCALPGIRGHIESTIRVCVCARSDTFARQAQCLKMENCSARQCDILCGAFNMCVMKGYSIVQHITIESFRPRCASVATFFL